MSYFEQAFVRGKNSGMKKDGASVSGFACKGYRRHVRMDKARSVQNLTVNRFSTTPL